MTFTPGQVTKTITINVIGETIKESNETYTVRLSSPTNAVIGDSDGLGTIIDDDQTPQLAVQSTSLSEGNTGKKIDDLRHRADQRERRHDDG